MPNDAKRHDWSKLYPRGSWPVYECQVCGLQCCPTANELHDENQPAWFDSECKGRVPLTKDDIDWLRGTGRYAQ